MTVAAFMDLALYHPTLGYYARAAQRSGRAGDFFTSVDVGPLFGDLDFEQFAEDRPDVDAGKKIARAPGSLGGAGVIAELGMVEREIHERGHRNGAALTNHISNRQSEI